VDASLDGLGRSLREEIATSAAETRRHFEVVAEDMMSRIRVYSDGIAANTQRLEHHGTRIGKVERRSIQRSPIETDEESCSTHR
jgi:hypothetical protein